MADWFARVERPNPSSQILVGATFQLDPRDSANQNQESQAFSWDPKRNSWVDVGTGENATHDENMILGALSSQAHALGLVDATARWDDAREEPHLLLRRAEVAVDTSRSPDMGGLARDLQATIGQAAVVHVLEDRIFLYFSDHMPKRDAEQVIDVAMKQLGSVVGNLGFANSGDWAN